MLEISALNVWITPRRSRPLHIVRGLDLRLEHGSSVGLIGESGSGKTTAVLSILGLLPPNARVSGTILLDGEEILGAGARSTRRHRWNDISMVFQGSMNAFNPVVPVGRQIAEPMHEHLDLGPQVAQRRVGELLELVGLSAHHGTRYAHELSGGMRQRAAIAMALACEPRYLLADEPTSALDALVQRQVLEVLARLGRELRLSIVLVTHDLGIVGSLCQRAAVMYAGRIVEEADIVSLHTRPRHPYTRRLLAAIPDIRQRERPVAIPGVPPRLDQEICGCAFADRCLDVRSACRDRSPPRVIDGRGTVECHLCEPG